MEHMDVIDLRDRVVIVTGASSGIGAATARALAEAGAHPVLAARREDRLARLAEELGGAVFMRTDVTDRGDVARLVATAVERYGRVDGLVNDAGVSFHHPVASFDLNAFKAVLEVNVIGLVAMLQAVVPVMRERHFGRIVNISSGTTRMVLPGVGGYAATKAAVNTLSAAARVELEPEGIAVSLVLPSITATEFGGGMYASGHGNRPGLVAHPPEYVAQVILRALRTGEERIDIPHGPQQEELTRVP